MALPLPTPFAHRPRTARIDLLLWLALTAVAAGGCKLLESTCAETDPQCLSRATGGGLDTGCERTIQCRQGLECRQQRCQAVGESPVGARCSLTAECQAALYCDHTRTCQRAGNAEPGGPCASTAECEAGLGCGLGRNPLLGICRERGVGDLGSSCGQAEDCEAGLHCLPLGERSICQSLPATDVEVPPLPAWQGANCSAEATAPTAYFSVPDGADPTDGDFYRLPFPNDIRRRDGQLDLSGHPQPDHDSGFTTAGRILTALDGSAAGFSTTPVVVFRFSAAIHDNHDELMRAVQIVDITPGAATLGQQAQIDVLTGEHSHYVCGEFLAVRVLPEAPLLSEHTYAALVSRSLRTEDAQSFARGPDLDPVLGSSPPAEPKLRTAHGAYAPLRSYLADVEQSADEWLNAAVFTVGRPTGTMSALRAALSALPPPQVVADSVTVCDEGAVSPCEPDVPVGSGEGTELENPTGLCATRHPEVVILHGKIRLPIFQQGTAPYEFEGGDITLGARSEPVRSEEVCFGLSLPTTPAPEQGYPLLVYAHGTRGSFASPFSAGGFGPTLAASAARAATLAFDMPQHGSRRGDSELDPAKLFFNVGNPEAARGNVLQGAADLISVLHFAIAGTLPAPPSLPAPIHFDPDRIAVLGHSQGATHTSLILADETRVRAFVLSGMGGHLTTTLLHKQQPLPVADLIGGLLADMVTIRLVPEPELVAGPFNPMLALMQTFHDSADPINFARAIHVDLPADARPESHVFMTYGIADHYTPDPSQAAYAVAAQLPHVTPHLSALSLPSAEPPALESVTSRGLGRTVAVRQYRARGQADGHFVAVKPGQDGYADVLDFLEAALSGSVPPIGH